MTRIVDPPIRSLATPRYRYVLWLVDWCHELFMCCSTYIYFSGSKEDQSLYPGTEQHCIHPTRPAAGGPHWEGTTSCILYWCTCWLAVDVSWGHWCTVESICVGEDL